MAASARVTWVLRGERGRGIEARLMRDRSPVRGVRVGEDRSTGPQAATSLASHPPAPQAATRSGRGFGGALTPRVGSRRPRTPSGRARPPCTPGAPAMNHRPLGNSGLRVSELSLGSWTTYGGSVAPGEATPIVRRAFELGVNLFDTADVYVKGGAERALGEAIRDLPRGELVIATKCMGRVWDGPLGRGLSRKHIFDALDASLVRLGLDYVD